MELAGSFTFTADAAAVWRLLTDPAAMSQAMPDCSNLQQVAPGRYVGRLHLHAGALQSDFQGTVTLTEIEPEQGYRLHADGQSPEGRLSGKGKIWLEAAGAETIVRYRGAVAATGQIAAVGEAYLQTTARALLRQVFGGMARQLEGEEEPGQTTDIAAAPPPEVDMVKVGAATAISGAFVTMMTALIFRAAYRRWIAHLARRVARILQEQKVHS